MATVGDAPGELREDIPLKSGTKSARICACSEDCLGGSRFISVSLGVLSAIITFALLLQIYYGDYQVVPHGSVASDSKDCSEVGTSILKAGGNAVDSAIATAFCLAVINPHVTGLDAEGQIMVYNHRTRKNPDVVDFRHNPNNKINEPLPRMVVGLAYVHQLYSILPWKDLVLPAVNVARKGFLVPKCLVSAIKNSNMPSLYGNLEPGQFIRLEQLADTLQNIAYIAETDLYNYITLENTPLKSMALQSEFKDYKIYVPNTPSIGPELLVNLRKIDYHNFTRHDTTLPEYVYRLGEITENTLNELNITSNFHEGTSSNVAVIDKNDNYVSLITGLYQIFGAREMATSGYLLDVKDKTKIFCTRVPIIITDGYFICGKRIVLGANNIIIASQIVSSLLIAGENATASIEMPRFNIIQNNTVGLEDTHTSVFSDDVVEYLETLGHLVHMKEPYSSCNIVEKIGDHLNSHSDSRGGGFASRFR